MLSGHNGFQSAQMGHEAFHGLDLSRGLTCAAPSSVIAVCLRWTLALHDQA